VPTENSTDTIYQAHYKWDVTSCTPVSEVVRSHHLRFFGQLAHTAPAEDHHRMIANMLRPPADWRRPIGRPRTTWLRTVDKDVQRQNFGVYTACRNAKDRDIWRQVISTATLWQEFAKKKKKKNWAFREYRYRWQMWPEICYLLSPTILSGTLMISACWMPPVKPAAFMNRCPSIPITDCKWPRTGQPARQLPLSRQWPHDITSTAPALQHTSQQQLQNKNSKFMPLCTKRKQKKHMELTLNTPI